MILGTVELGLDYGINNNSGKPTYQQAFELLDAAWSNGIRELDTAAAYGNSEEIIGNYQSETDHIFLIDTKLPVAVAKAQFDESLNTACKRLRTESIYLLYLHSFEQCKDDGILEWLQRQKEERKIEHIGISIYEPEEMNYILEKLPFVDTIQIPFNILDSHRWVRDDLLKRVKIKNKRLYARSIFLQGLIFKTIPDAFIDSIGAKKYIAAINRIAKSCGLSKAELAYQYVFQTPEIDEIIIGCQSVDDVMINAVMLNSEKKLGRGVREELGEISRNIPKVIIDPRKWRRV